MAVNRVWVSMLFGFALAAPVSNAAAADLTPPPGLAAPAKPTRLPEFSLPTAAGAFVKSGDMRGKVVVVRFWATW